MSNRYNINKILLTWFLEGYGVSFFGFRCSPFILIFIGCPQWQRNGKKIREKISSIQLMLFMIFNGGLFKLMGGFHEIIYTHNRAHLWDFNINHSSSILFVIFSGHMWSLIEIVVVCDSGCQKFGNEMIH